MSPTQQVRRFDVATRLPVGEVVPATGAQIGRARYAFEPLWMTVPWQDVVLLLAPVDGP